MTSQLNQYSYTKASGESSPRSLLLAEKVPTGVTALDVTGLAPGVTSGLQGQYDAYLELANAEKAKIPTFETWLKERTEPAAVEALRALGGKLPWKTFLISGLKPA